MLPDGRSDRDAGGWTSALRHRSVPERTVGGEVIVARPRDGEGVKMSSVAALVWRLLVDWMTEAELDRRIAEAFPEVAGADRIAARTEILQMLEDDDLLERG